MATTPACHVRKWMHKKDFPLPERERIQGILASWGFTSVSKVRYKPKSDTIVVWRRDYPQQVFITEQGQTLSFSPRLTLSTF